MKVHLALLIEKLKTRFWILPTLVTLLLVAILLWLQTIEVPSGSSSYWQYLLLYDASPQGARLILSSIATAVMTVVGVLFSITIVVLQQVSTQYTPRVIQNFIRSTSTQLVLGFYIGTFTYSLLLLRKIHDKDAPIDIKIPQLAMSFGIILAIICLGLLILYVHHITHSIQSTQIISEITKETLESIDNIVTDRNEFLPQRLPVRESNEQEATLFSKKRGYLRSIHWEHFNRYLDTCPWQVRVLPSPGDYIQNQVPLLKINGNVQWSEKTQKKILTCFDIGQPRNLAQDPGFGVRQLVDIGIRALSPAVNDPSTAMEAIHGITTILLHYIDHYPIQNVIQIGRNQIVEIPPIEADHFIGLCFDQLIQFGSDHLPVISLVSQNLKLASERSQSTELVNAIYNRIHALDKTTISMMARHSWMKRQAA